LGGRFGAGQGGRRGGAGGGEAAHDVGDVGAEDFEQFQDGGKAWDVAAVLEDSYVRRRQAGALGEFASRPSALLAQMSQDGAEALRVRVDSHRARHGSKDNPKRIQPWFVSLRGNIELTRLQSPSDDPPD